MFFFLYRDQGVLGKEVTPFVLQRVNELTKGQSLQASILVQEEDNGQRKGITELE